MKYRKEILTNLTYSIVSYIIRWFIGSQNYSEKRALLISRGLLIWGFEGPIVM